MAQEAIPHRLTICLQVFFEQHVNRVRRYQKQLKGGFEMNSIAKSHFVQSGACNMAPDNPPSPKTFVIRMEDKRLKMYSQDRILKKLATGTLLPTNQVMTPDGKWIEIAKCPGFRTFCAKLAAMEGKEAGVPANPPVASDASGSLAGNSKNETGFPEPEKKRGENPPKNPGGSSDSLLIFQPSKVAKIPRPLVKNPEKQKSKELVATDKPVEKKPAFQEPQIFPFSDDPKKNSTKARPGKVKSKAFSQDHDDSTSLFHRYMPTIITGSLLVILMTGAVGGLYMALKDVRWEEKPQKGLPAEYLPTPREGVTQNMPEAPIKKAPVTKPAGPLVPLPDHFIGKPPATKNPHENKPPTKLPESDKQIPADDIGKQE